MRRVRVYWRRGKERTPIGELAEAGNGEIALQWSHEYLESSVNLSPFSLEKQGDVIVMDRKKFDGVHGLFNDHIPDGFGRRLMIRAFKAQGFLSSDFSPLDALQFVGDDGMGALSFEPFIEKKEKWAGKIVDLDELSEAVTPILSGNPSAVFDEWLQAGSAPNGVRPKFLGIRDGDTFTIGTGQAEGERWLIKYRSETFDPDDIALIEYAYFVMARQAGLQITDCELFRTKRGVYFGTKRFDWSEEGPFHMHSYSGMLNTPPEIPTFSYDQFGLLAQRIGCPAKDLEGVLRLAAFNTYTHNLDDHAKNVSFLMDINGKWRTAPAYDLTYNDTRAGLHKMWINDSGLPNKSDIVALGQSFGLRKNVIKAIEEEVRQAVSRFPEIAGEVGIKKARIRVMFGKMRERMGGRQSSIASA